MINRQRVFSAVVSFAAFVGASEVFGSTYDVVVLGDRPAFYLALSAPAGQLYEWDRSHAHRRADYVTGGRALAKTRLPNGDRGTVFNGSGQFAEIDSDSALSVAQTGVLTFEAWIRPDVLQFPVTEGSGYVYWAGKGESGQHEYALRMYSRQNSEQRPNRISGYAFNLNGGLGSGSYFQDVVQAGQWLHVAVVIDARTPQGTVSIYRDARLRKTTPLSQFNVTPRPGNAPLRIGTRDLNSYFKGAIAKVAVYNYALSPQQLKRHFDLMR